MAHASTIEQPTGRTIVTVRFQTARSCDVSVDGPPSRPGSVRLQPDPGSVRLQRDPGSVRLQPDAGVNFECDVPAVAPGAGVDLVVILPSGAARPTAVFPRLDWTERGGRWTGTASLPAAPAFVRVAGPTDSLARRARWLDVFALAATALAILWTILYTARAAAAGEVS